MIERQRREWRHRRRRGVMGCGEGIAPSQKIFSSFSLKIAIFAVFWAAIFTVRRTVLYADHADW